MNKNLFTTSLSPRQTGEMAQQYALYVDQVATSLVQADPDCNSEIDFRSRAEQEVTWSSWIVSVSKRNFAFHAALAAVDADHTMGAVRPTTQQAAVAVARHIARRCIEVADKARPAYYKLKFKAANRWVTIGDMDPATDSDAEFVLTRDTKPNVEAAVRRFYDSYNALGVTPPLIEVVAFDGGNLVIEEFTVHF